MGKYLDKFRGTLNQRQSDQIFKLLNKQRDMGQIRNVEEFTRRLDSLIRELTGTVMQPTLKLFPADGNLLTSSEQYNYMLDRVRDDLQSSFEEANNINEVQVSHDALVRDVILKNLRAGVAELQSKVALYEFLNQDSNGFDSNIFSTFRESKEGRTQRGTADTASLFTDPRTNTLFPTSQDASVELIGERLTLPISNKTFHEIKSIRQVFDSTCPQSDLMVTPPSVELKNIIDGEHGTYWVQSWLFTEKQKFVKMKLETDLGVVREINFLEIEPVTHEGFYLESVYYMDGTGTYQNLNVPEQLLTGNIGLKIKKVFTRKLIFVFRNENGHYTNFEYKNQSTLLEQSQIAKQTVVVQPDKQALSDSLIPLVASDKIKEWTDLKSSPTSQYNGFEFQIGFDNIRVGLSDYSDAGVYVSSPLECSSSALLGLRVKESRPLYDGNTLSFTAATYDVDPSPSRMLGSIEYWIIRQDLNPNGTLLRTTTFPILPMGVSRIIEEQLVLNDKSEAALTNNDTGNLMFYATYDPTHPDQDSDILVYRNGIEILNVDTNPTAIEGWLSTSTLNADKLPNNNQAMRFRIKIRGGKAGDIYTVTYTPMVSSTQVVPQPPYNTMEFKSGIQIVDLVGDLSARRIQGQVVVTDAVGGSETTTTSRFYCTIILRQNTADISISPAVEEYTLFAGKRDATKFAETT